MRIGTTAAAAIVALALVAGGDRAAGQEAAADLPVASPGAAATTSTDPTVERGRYLVHEAALCVQCHSPRDRRGELDTSRLLTGGAIPFKSPWTGARRWAFQAPNLRNALGYTEEEWVRFLGTGVRRSGDTPRPPMPPYRLSEQDARAIYEYLKSL